jgi:hypothetical protein
LCSSYVSSFSSVIASMSGRKRTRFLIRSFPATTVQTGKHHDRKPGI